MRDTRYRFQRTTADPNPDREGGATFVSDAPLPDEGGSDHDRFLTGAVLSTVARLCLAGHGSDRRAHPNKQNPDREGGATFAPDTPFPDERDSDQGRFLTKAVRTMTAS